MLRPVVPPAIERNRGNDWGGRKQANVNLQAIFKLPAAAATLVGIVTIAIAACGGGGGGGVTNASCPHGSAHIFGYGGGGGGGSSNCPPPSTPSAQPVGLLLAGENNVMVAPYGNVLGFFNGTNGMPPSGSNVVHLTANQNVTFTSVEGAGSVFPQHTASFIQTWSNSFPPNPSIPSSASAAGTIISSTGFSTGPLNAGQTSAVFNSGGPGMFTFGCAFHYLSNGMRTVIIVQ